MVRSGMNRAHLIRTYVPVAVLYLLLALVFIINTGFGIYSFGPWRVYVLGGAVLVALVYLAFTVIHEPEIELLWPRWVLLALALATLWGNWGWAATPRLLPLLHAIAVGLGAVLLASALYPLVARDGRTPGLWPIFVAAVIAFYVAIIVAVPRPHIDVWDHLNKAGDAMLAGKNPYAVPIPDFYKGRAWYGFDAPGFPYPPQVLGVATLARWIAIDVRYLLVACIFIGAAFARATALRSGWSHATADLIGMLYIFLPRQSFIVKYSHSEPVTGMLLAAAVYFLVARREVLGLVLLGLFASSKQYLAMMAPLLLLYCRTPRRIALLGAGAASAWLPFLLWDPKALWRAAFEVHMSRPPRKDAITFNAWLINRGKEPMARSLAVVAGIVASILPGLRFRPGVATLCLGLASALLVMLSVSPQAFQNYYCLCVWILLCALAATPNRSADPEPAT